MEAVEAAAVVPATAVASIPVPVIATLAEAAVVSVRTVEVAPAQIAKEMICCSVIRKIRTTKAPPRKMTFSTTVMEARRRKKIANLARW